MSADLLGTLSPSQYIVTVAGRVCTGWSEDDAITLERNEDDMVTYDGMDNTFTNMVILKSRGELRLRFQETSPMNDYLTAVLAAQRLGRITTFPWSVGRGDSTVAGGLGWIKKQPSITLGATVKEYEWNIGVDDAAIGLNRIAALIEEAVSSSN